MTSASAFSVYLQNNYSDLLSVANTIVQGDGRELLHDVVTDLMTRGVPDGICARGEGKTAEIRRYVIASLRMSWHSGSSRYYQRHKRPIIMEQKHRESIYRELYESSEHPDVTLAIRFMNEKLDEMNEFDRIVCVLWYNGNTLKDIREGTGISLTTLSKSLNRAKEHLKNEVERSWRQYRESHSSDWY